MSEPFPPSPFLDGATVRMFCLVKSGVGNGLGPIHLRSIFLNHAILTRSASKVMSFRWYMDQEATGFEGPSSFHSFIARPHQIILFLNIFTLLINNH